MYRGVEHPTYTRVYPYKSFEPLGHSSEQWHHPHRSSGLPPISPLPVVLPPSLNSTFTLFTFHFEIGSSAASVAAAAGLPVSQEIMHTKYAKKDFT